MRQTSVAHSRTAERKTLQTSDVGELTQSLVGDLGIAQPKPLELMQIPKVCRANVGNGIEVHVQCLKIGQSFCDGPGLSDTGGSQIMVPDGGPKDEPIEG